MRFPAAPRVCDGLSCGRSNFGVLRLALALAVVVSHAFSVATGRAHDEPLVLATGFTLGEHAVNGFFAISGFLVAMSYERRGWRDYVLARTLRIAPGLIAATLFVSLVLGAAMTRLDLAAYLADARLWRFITGTLTTFKTAAALPGVFDHNRIPFPMGTVWTLKYEVLCYLGLLVAGILGLLRRRDLLSIAWVVLALATILREVVAPEGGEGVETALRLPLIFLTGSLIYLWREKVPLSLWALAAIWLAIALLAHTPAYKVVLYVGTAWSAIILALAPALTRWRTDPAIDITYGVYLYGWPVQQVLYALFPTLGALALLGPALVVTVLLGAASWYLVEAPALRLKRRLLPG